MPDNGEVSVVSKREGDVEEMEDEPEVLVLEPEQEQEDPLLLTPEEHVLLREMLVSQPLLFYWLLNIGVR